MLTDSGRAAKIGSDIDCPLCDRAELPPGLRLARTAGPFDADSLPAGLRREHRVADGNWGALRVIEGSVIVSMATDPPVRLRLTAGTTQGLPPAVPHRLTLEGSVRLEVDFLVSQAAGPPPDRSA